MGASVQGGTHVGVGVAAAGRGARGSPFATRPPSHPTAAQRGGRPRVIFTGDLLALVEGVTLGVRGGAQCGVADSKGVPSTVGG